MSTFVVGDVQGCFATLKDLLEAVGFDRRRDNLVFVGDLVNRGPDNLGVLRFVRDLGERGATVLGNHDLHLVARAAGAAGRKERDTIEDVLEAPDQAELVEWLRAQPSVLERGRDLIVHAGVHPSWSRADILARGGELSAALGGADWREAIAKIAGDRGSGLGAVSAVLQRLRMLDRSDRPIDFAGPPTAGPKGARAWFDVPHARGSDTRVLFGHWAALGLMVRADVVALDTGCVWGRSLTAFNLEAGTVTSVAASR